MAAILLALGSAIGWGLSDFLGGLKSRSSSILSVLLVSQVTALGVLGFTVVVRGLPAPDGRFLAYAAGAGLGEAVGIAALYRGLAVGRMTVVASIAAAAPVLPVLAGLVAGEVPGPVASVGVVLAAAGVVITSVQRDTANTTTSGASGVGYGLLAAAGFGSFFLAMDFASEADVPWALLTARLTSVTAVGAVTVAVIGRSGRLRVQRADLPVMALIGALIVVADGMYAVATTLGLLGVAAVLGSLHTVVTIGLARIVLGERLARIQRAGIVTVLAGVLAIAGSPV
ncbi:EamA family transporter [Actinoplanes sp. NPDC051513]|uniref:EamA family transporter n=1 Tax=Actinoplanes sp. NPDC051513 TaxID=3363908 RepID=UPI00379240A4